MTINYAAKVATSSFLGFLKLLFRWQGSIYKHVLPHFVLFVIVYYGLNLAYRYALEDTGKQYFEMVARYCSGFTDTFAVTLVLGFYSTLVVSRWWDRFMSLPWPDNMALCLTANLHCRDEPATLLRRTIMRYLSLASVLTLTGISTAVKKRFPSLPHLVEAGFLLEHEKWILQELETTQNKYFIPIAWCTNIISHARKIGKIDNDVAFKALVDELNEFRRCLEKLFNYDWISVPLSYTQVVTISVYTFLLACLMGRQTLPDTDVYVPLFTFLQFLFFMGWLKVCEMLVNPFGEDDEDFDLNLVIDKNLKISYFIVDDLHCRFPEMKKDIYWNNPYFAIPYTRATAGTNLKPPFMGSATDTKLSAKEAEFIYPQFEPLEEDDTETKIDMYPEDLTPFASPTLRPLFPKEKKKRKPKKPVNCLELCQRKDKKSTPAGYRDPTAALEMRVDASSGDEEGYLPEADDIYYGFNQVPTSPIYDDIFIPASDSRPRSLVHQLSPPPHVIIAESPQLARSAIPDFIIPAPTEFQEPLQDTPPYEAPQVRTKLPEWLYDGDSSPEKPEKKHTIPRIPPEGLYSSPDDVTEDDEDEFFLPRKNEEKLDTLSSIKSGDLDSLSSVSLDELVFHAKAGISDDSSEDVSDFSEKPSTVISELDDSDEAQDFPSKACESENGIEVAAPSLDAPDVRTPTLREESPSSTSTYRGSQDMTDSAPVPEEEQISQHSEGLSTITPSVNIEEESIVPDQLDKAQAGVPPERPSDSPTTAPGDSPDSAAKPASPDIESTERDHEVTDVMPSSAPGEDIPPSEKTSREQEVRQPEDLDLPIPYPYGEITKPTNNEKESKPQGPQQAVLSKPQGPQQAVLSKPQGPQQAVLSSDGDQKQPCKSDPELKLEAEHPPPPISDVTSTSPGTEETSISMTPSSARWTRSPRLACHDAQAIEVSPRGQRRQQGAEFSDPSADLTVRGDSSSDQEFSVKKSPSMRRPLHVGQVSPRPGGANWRMTTSRMRAVQALAPPRLRTNRRRIILPPDPHDDSNSNDKQDI